MDLEKYIRDIENYPKDGITFRDITTLLKDKDGFKLAIDALCELVPKDVDKIVGIEARGFIFGAPVAYKLNKGFVAVRKLGKLPYKTISESYELEYGTDSIEVHLDSIEKGEKIVLIDDLVATGGSSLAACKMIEKLGGEVSRLLFLIELDEYDPRNNLLKGRDVKSIIKY